MAKLVLQVEDSLDDARLMELAFRKAGIANPLMTVDTAENAISYFKGDGLYTDRTQFPLPGILMVDLKLPQLDGVDLLFRLARESLLEGVLVVMVSGYPDPNRIKLAQSLGAASVLVKPVSAEALAGLAESHTGYWTFGP
jgi:CheY-like chemotaxis protein